MSGNEIIFISEQLLEINQPITPNVNIVDWWITKS